MAIPKQLSDLINKFKEHRTSYTSSSYNETQLRREFLDPFFESLGWDVSNKQGYAEVYKEVIHEDAIKVGTATKAPDYSFRIGGYRKFFVEAKKPFVNIKDDISPAFQLRRYAWSGKLPLSVLTDFEEFAVYDCRIKPNKIDKASVGRILYIRYEEYEKRWDEIAAIFSKDSILKGSFDKYAESAKGKKGTSEVDNEFLCEIERWRDLLARNIAIKNPDLSQRELNFAIQRTIDRIIFLRICEDRGIEQYGSLMALLNGDNVYKRMRQNFQRADEIYNSGLFHFRDEKGRAEPPDTLTLSLQIDDKPLKDIIANLYYPESPYEFSVLPADILGQVYEQFLGKVIRLTAGHQAKVEDKPEVKKAGGVFYTPTYIVDYIVKNTVGKLIEGKSPKQIEKLKILDPACGSGTFLIQAYQFLLDYNRDWYIKDGIDKYSKGKEPKLTKLLSGEWRLSTTERKKILLNSIFGVDIDSQAVEVTKLSLLLKVLEGENEQSLAQQMTLWHERALPDLENNIKCGNSLISSDFYEGTQTGMNLFENEEQYRINAFDWDGENGFKEIMKNGGFDAVIGNPPYIKVQELDYSSIDYLKSKYAVAWQRIDISIIFTEKAITLLNSSGLNGFIITNQFLQTEYGRKARLFLLNQVEILKVIDFGDLPVFRNALTYVSIFILKKGRTRNFDYFRLSALSNEIENVSSISIPSKSLSESPWILEGKSKRKLLDKLRSDNIRLDSCAKCWAGLFTGKDDILMFDKSQLTSISVEKDSLLPIIRAQDCERYSYAAPSKYVLYPYHEIDGKTQIFDETTLQRKYPKAFNYLKEHKSDLQKRKDSRKEFSENKQWYALTRFGKYSIFRKQKIVSPGEVKKNKFALDETGSGFSCARVFAITSENTRLNLLDLLGILNSKLIEFFLHAIAPLKQGGYYSYSSSFIDQLPLPSNILNDSTPSSKLRTLVNNLLSLNRTVSLAKTDHEKNLTQRQIIAIEQRINELVYELYGLSNEEIKIIEDNH